MGESTKKKLQLLIVLFIYANMQIQYKCTHKISPECNLHTTFLHLGDCKASLLQFKHLNWLFKMYDWHHLIIISIIIL